MLGKYIGTLNTLSTEKTKLLPLTAYNRVRPSNDKKKIWMQSIKSECICYIDNNSFLYEQKE